MLWTYADARDGGSYERVGGGPYDPATGTYGPGRLQRRRHRPGRRGLPAALAADRRRGQPASRPTSCCAALTYLQTADRPERRQRRAVDAAGRDAQPQRRARRAARPVRLRAELLAGPHGVGARRGLRRLRRRPTRRSPRSCRTGCSCRSAALEPQVLDDYGRYQVADGVRVPAWLIVDGADATRRGRARPGRVRRGRAAGAGPPDARCGQLAEGIAAMSGGDRASVAVRRGAARGRSPARSGTPGARRCRPRSPPRPDALRPPRPAAGPRSTTPPASPARCSTSGGPDNGWLPDPGDRTQIAYGVDSRVQRLLAVGRRRPAGRGCARWPASPPAGSSAPTAPGRRSTTRPPASRTTASSADGTVNRNSGAESTIHGLLTMLALDARPAVRGAGVGWTRTPVRDGGDVGPRRRPRPPAPPWSRRTSAWTGESQWSGGAYLALTGVDGHAGPAGRRPAAGARARGAAAGPLGAGQPLGRRW